MVRCHSSFAFDIAADFRTALILVDPWMRNRLHFFDQESYQETGGHPASFRVNLSGVFQCTPTFPLQIKLPETGSTDLGHPTQDDPSIFTHLLAAYSSSQLETWTEPFQCAMPVRKLVLHRWVDFLNHAIHCLVITKGEPYVNNTHFNSPVSALWAPRTEEWLLGRLVKWSRRLHMEHTIIRGTMRNLGIDLTQPSHPGLVGLAEARQWRYIHDKLLEYKSLYDDTAASYIQVMSLREALASNDQASSLGRITLIAALFTPVSLVSGVLSKQGPFSPEGRHFWTFFTIVLPLILLVWLTFFTTAGAVLKKRFTTALGRRFSRPPLLPVSE